MRLRIIVLIVLLGFGGAITLDRLSPATAPARASVSFDPEGGVLTCPYLTEPGTYSSVMLANLASRPSSIRISFSRQKGGPVVVPVSLGAMSVKAVPLPAKVKGPSGAVIEYAGGVVVASHTMYLPQTSGPIVRGAGVAVSPCQGTGEGDVVVAHASTLHADSMLALFNPGSADADVSISLLVDGRKIEPVRLARRLVASHSRRDFRLGDFAFNARAVTVVVHANAGRVAAEALMRTGAGAEFLPAQAPSRDLVAVAGRSGAVAVAAPTVIGPDDSGIDVREIDASRQRSAPGFPPSLPPSGTKVVGVADVGRGKESALAMDVSVGSPLVAATRWTVRGPGGHAEIASLPAGSPSQRWGAVIGGVGRFGLERLVLVNAGTTDVHARVSIIGKSVTSKSVTITAGRLGVLTIGKGTGPIGLIVEADGPITAACLSTAVAGTGATTATAMPASPLTPIRDVGVAVDQRAGVPAILPTS
jgi:hypothetical protein